MTYNPLIPEGTNNISVDRAAIKVNFQQANTLYANDHYAFDDATSANRGYHKQVYFPVASVADPGLGGFDGVFFTKDDTNDTSANPQVYWKNSSNTYQITNRFRSSTAAGYWVLPNGSGGATTRSIILMWGTDTIPNTASGQVNVSFNTIANYTGGPAGFPNNVFNIQVSVQGASSADSPKFCINSPSQTGFQFRFSSNNQLGTLYWYAIGN